MIDPTVPLELRDRPFASPVGDLVAGVIRLAQVLLQERPDLVGAPGVWHVTFDSEAATILVCLAQSDGRMRLVERFHADPHDAETFGLSAGLPTAPSTAPVQTH